MTTDDWHFRLRDDHRWFQFTPDPGCGPFKPRAVLNLFEGETSEDWEHQIRATFSPHDIDELGDYCKRLAAHLRGEL